MSHAERYNWLNKNIQNRKRLVCVHGDTLSKCLNTKRRIFLKEISHDTGAEYYNIY